MRVYKALAECIISYCISSWGGASKGNILLLERAQRMLLKVAMGLPFRYPTDKLYKKCEVLSVRKQKPRCNKNVKYRIHKNN